MSEQDPFARACSDAMHANDRTAQMMGIHIVETIAGQAVLTMKVRNDMLNGHDVCHG